MKTKIDHYWDTFNAVITGLATRWSTQTHATEDYGKIAHRIAEAVHGSDAAFEAREALR